MACPVATVGVGRRRMARVGIGGRGRAMARMGICRSPMAGMRVRCGWRRRRRHRVAGVGVGRRRMARMGIGGSGRAMACMGICRSPMPGVRVRCGWRRRRRHRLAGVGVGRRRMTRMRTGRGGLRRRGGAVLVMGVRVLGEGGGGDQRQRRGGRDQQMLHWAFPSSGRTVTTRNIPACMCSSMWQWKAQSPGSLAVRSNETLPPGSTLTVCLRG